MIPLKNQQIKQEIHFQINLLLIQILDIEKKNIFLLLDGPEDIHYRFVDLHKQRKMFYENLCNKLEDNENNIDNKANINDFEKNEYSEYFDNYNKKVPLI